MNGKKNLPCLRAAHTSEARAQSTAVSVEFPSLCPFSNRIVGFTAEKVVFLTSFIFIDQYAENYISI